MKVTFTLAALALVPGMFLMQAGGATVAVIDFDRAIADTPEGKEAITKLTAFGSERRAAIEAKLKEADDVQNRIRTQGPALSEAARTQLTRDLQSVETAVETMQAEAQERMGRMRQELLGPVEAKTAKAVNTYAAERGLRIVLDASVLRDGLVYVHDTADITTEIIRRIASDIRNTGPSNALFAPSRDPETPVQRMLHSRWFHADFLKPNPLFAPAATAAAEAE